MDGMVMFNGKTSPLSEKVRGLYLMVTPSASFYWVKLSDDELNSQKPFDKIVRSGNFHLLNRIETNRMLKLGKFQWKLIHSTKC